MMTKEEITKRKAELDIEFTKGKNQLELLNKQVEDTKSTMLRINGAWLEMDRMEKELEVEKKDG